jgi:hypothetical protein
MNRNFHTIHPRGTFLCAVILLLLGSQALSQPRLELRLLKPNTPDYYYYQLYFAAYCADKPIYDLEKRQLILEERLGLVDTNDYIIDMQPDSLRNACYDIALLIDNSSQMTATMLAEATQAAIAFIDSMTLPCQTISIITYADRPTLLSFLSSDRDASKQSLASMTLGGRRALYDAMLAGMIELSTNGSARNKLVLALTTGENSTGITLPPEIASASINQNIRVFVLPLGDVIASEELTTLCRNTGGFVLKPPSGEALPQTLQAFEGFTQREFDEYRLVRRTRDPFMRNLLIRMRLEACDDSVWVSHVFFQEDPTAVGNPPAPGELQLGQSYPNPAHRNAGEISIPFRLGSAAASRFVLLEIMDVLGRRVAVLTHRQLPPGAHVARFDASSLLPGIYWCRLSDGREFRQKTFIVR